MSAMAIVIGAGVGGLVAAFRFDLVSTAHRHRFVRRAERNGAAIRSVFESVSRRCRLTGDRRPHHVRVGRGR